MIIERSGDLLRDDAQALVNPVNTAGVMGKGLALQFKRAFPANFTSYAEACADGRLRPGKVLAVQIGDERWVINFPTKRHWRSASRLEDIEAGLSDLSRTLTELDISSVAVPPLGCGHGGLAWGAVHPLITDRLGSLDLEVRLFVPETRSTEAV
ncbi:macro domain-containing protein [Actinomadura sp. GTD37]|uniref:macro domain-containing protein n=1 Tax=Actinomadura sp. GTD37 TaxID=1778030 RepID=UPI0035BF227F